MNAPIHPELLRAGPLDAAQPVAAAGFRYVWQGKFGSMTIEVAGGQAYVNGEVVEPARALESPKPEVAGRADY